MTPAIVASIHVLTGFGLGVAATLSTGILLWLRKNGNYKLVEVQRPRRWREPTILDGVNTQEVTRLLG
jgi:hypothetical protein